MRPRAVFFDVGNTLLQPYPSVSSVCQEVLSEFGHSADLEAIESLMPLVDAYYEDRYRADDTFWTDEEETSSVWVGMYSLLCERLGIADQAPVIARRVYDEFGKPGRWRPYPDVAPAVTALRDAGIMTGIISNWDRRLASLIEGLGLGGMFDVVVSSADVGLRKPDPRVFVLACERLGVAPEEAVHVGDHHYADVLGARAVGMTPVLIQRTGSDVMPAMAACATIRTFVELPDVLGLED
ncbi:HAD-IA family hydrolase [Coriobacteriia bacterium Es71-Z0120]|uniref:HAD family hydrolase n=1 Tax=Parvivirga hydrogeniphila TaxID=2939460 RepID=UPI002260969A|nr:HAD-IA family hydrolase [Parvivirga hydrogeniphila]MCL4078908.1 HAD-IA family hydrolase [Parvivirga hydrogeniphila]